MIKIKVYLYIPFSGRMPAGTKVCVSWSVEPSDSLYGDAGIGTGDCYGSYYR